MRKLIVSNLLLIMFLVGAASGFFVSNVGWWGLYHGAHALEQVHASGHAPLQHLTDAQRMALRSQSLFLDALRKQTLSEADMEAIARADGELRRKLADAQEADDPNRGHWARTAALNDRLAVSRQEAILLLQHAPAQAYRFQAENTQALAIELGLRLQEMAPLILQDSQEVHEQAVASNADTRRLLFALSIVATIFYCLIGAMTYRVSIARRRKSAERDREHAMFRTLFKSSNDGVILLQDERVCEFNPAALALFAAPASMEPGDITLARLQPPQQAGGAPSESALAQKIAQSRSGGAQHFEWRFRALDGREFPAEVAIDVAQLGVDSVVQLTIRDITRRKDTEKNMRLANQAFESSLDGIAITDARGDILTVNSMFTTITGYDMKEVVGRNPSLLNSGRQTPEFYAEMWRLLNEQGKWQGEVWNIRKNGDIYPQWLTISRVCDEHGRVSNFVGVFSDITERKSAEDRILHQVYYDQLTDLPNRVLLNDRLDQVLNLAKRRDDQPFAVMFLDLDRFKLINDTMGHQAGDQVLQQAAQRMRNCVRASDTIARMSGDEFTILLSEIADPKDAANVAQKILDAFRKPFRVASQEVYVSTSIGISVFPQDGRTIDVLLKNADMAMYRAKGAGGSWYEMYDACLGTLANERLSTETALHKALERTELELHYQPQFDCNSGRLAGFEALLRWRHPERGLLLPEAFLSIAEESGMIVPIGEWVLRTACAQAQAWRSEFPGHRLIAVNLSPRQFHSPDLERQVSEALRRSGLPHFCLELEVTESAIMKDLEAGVGVMRRLTELGVQFSIDDFGTGHSSLTLLKKLPIHALKVDQSFISNIDIDDDDASIVSAIVAMAQRLGLRVVGEGIEQQRQLSVLKRYDGVLGQGILLGRPMPAEAATSLMMDGQFKLAPA